MTFRTGPCSISKRTSDMNRVPRNVSLFLLAFLLAIVAGIAMSADDDVTVKQYFAITAEDDENSLRGQWYALGVLHGSYVGYIHSLIYSGLTAEQAVRLAEKHCGDLSLDTVERRLRRDPEWANFPLDIAVATIMTAECHREDKSS